MTGWKLARVAVTALALGACKRAGEVPEAAPAPHEDEKAHGELPRQLHLTAEATAAAGIRVEKVMRGRLAATVALPGEVAAEPDRTARLSAAVPGRLEQVSFNEGSVVKKGDVMAVLRVPDVGRLRGNLSSATAKAKAARSNVERLESLRKSGLGSEQALTDAQAEARALEAEARAIDEQLGAIGVVGEGGSGYLVPLRARLSGIVTARDAVVGQPIAADHVLATIVDLSEVWFIGRVFEKDLSRLKAGARAEVRLNAFPERSFEGVVDYVGQQVDPLARTLTARVRLENADAALRLGLFGTAHVSVDEAGPHADLLLAPLSAVTQVADKKVVFVRASDGDFVVHQVELGEASLGRVQVLSGLDEGEEVAAHGVFTLKSLMLKSTLAEDE